MTTTNQTPTMSVRRDIIVPLDRAAAFDLFAGRMGAWWPPEHHIGDSELAEVIVEPRPGGRWHEKGVDGSECEWGRVDVWDPPARLVLVWQLSPEFRYDPELETQVEVTFDAVTADSTRVTVEHHLDGFGEHAEAMRKVFEDPAAWSGTLERYAAVAAGG